MVAEAHRAPAARPLPRRIAHVLPLAVLAAAWTGAAAVLAMWWADTPGLSGAAGWLTGAGRITGLLAGYGCAVLLLLMARVPPLERYVGGDRLARWHAMGGRYTVLLALSHALLIVWGYALDAGTGVAGETTEVVLHYPEMLKGTAGFLLLVGTGAVSARAARRRLSYETWHYLHFATYLAVFLAFGHQLADGAQFTGDPAARAAWYALYLGVAAVLFWYRFAVPVRTGLRHRLRVTAVHPEGPGVVSVHVTGARLGELRALPGQYLRWRFLAPGLWWTANPYSLSAPPDGRGLRLTAKALGRHSAALARLRPGTRVWVEGPYGALTGSRRTAPGVLLIAGGVGITPLRALFETLYGDVVLLYRARRPADLVLRAELDRIAAARRARVVYSVGDPPGYALPMTAAALRAVVPDLAVRDVYVCGPPGMAEAAITAVRAAGVPRHRVHHESFTL